MLSSQRPIAGDSVIVIRWPLEAVTVQSESATSHRRALYVNSWSGRHAPLPFSKRSVRQIPVTRSPGRENKHTTMRDQIAPPSSFGSLRYFCDTSSHGLAPDAVA